MTMQNIYSTIGDDDSFVDEEEYNNEMKITITKKSDVDSRLWQIKIDDKFVLSKSVNTLKANSTLVINTLSKITGVAIQDRGQHPSYGIGESRIQCDYVEGPTEFETVKELKQYIVLTVKKIKERIKETKKEQSVTFYL